MDITTGVAVLTTGWGGAVVANAGPSGLPQARVRDIERRRSRWAWLWVGGGVVGVPVVGTVIGLLRTKRFDGLAITPSEAWWLVAWLLIAGSVGLSVLLRRSSGVGKQRDDAEVQVATATTNLTTAGSAPAGDVTAAVAEKRAADQALVESVAAERRSGLRALIVGADGRISTSKLQATLWTYAVLYALLYVLIVGWHVVPQGAPALAHLKDGFDGLIKHSFQPEYFALLGLPLSAALAAKALVTGKVQKGELTKSLSGSEGVANGVREAVANDKGEVDLLDFQYAAFNLVTLAYFFAHFFATTATDPSKGLPSIPATLLALAGVSSVTYTTKKALEGGLVPEVSAVLPKLIVLGGTTTLDIRGTGFLSTGRTSLSNRVLLNGALLPASDWSDTSVTATLPTDAEELRRLGLDLTEDSAAGEVVVLDDRAASSPPYPVVLRKTT